jgi:hypothetical protein
VAKRDPYAARPHRVEANYLPPRGPCETDVPEDEAEVVAYIGSDPLHAALAERVEELRPPSQRRGPVLAAIAAVLDA